MPLLSGAPLQRWRSSFEREYVQAVRAWLSWYDSEVDRARLLAEPLVELLPEGSVARTLAEETLDTGSERLQR